MIITILLLCTLWIPFYCLSFCFSLRSSATEVMTSLGQVGVRTTLFNTLYWNLGRKYSYLLNQFYRIGAVASLCTSLFAILFMMYNVYRFFIPEPISATPSPIQMAVMLPGVNVPFEQVPWLLFALLVSAALHEFGHALCANAEKCACEETGFWLMFGLPSAYVVIHQQDLENKTTFYGKLKIYCAGVWHNLVLCVLVMIVAFLLFPIRGNSWFFDHAKDGVFVWRRSSVASSPLDNILFSPTDYRPMIVKSVNSCSMAKQSYANCVQDLLTSNKIGYWVPERYVKEQSQLFGSKCCTEEHPSLVCFDQNLCIKARDMLHLNFARCDPNASTTSSSNMVCITPKDTLQDKNIQMVQIQIQDAAEVIYFGDVRALYSDVYSSPFQLSSPWSHLISLESIYDLEAILGYIFSISSALAILNMLPVPFLDGDHVFLLIAQKYLLPHRHGALVYILIRIICIFLLLCNLLIALQNTFKAAS